MAIYKYEKINGFVVQGYLDDIQGEVRLMDKEGNLRLYYYEKKGEKVLEGNLKKSRRAKESIQVMIKKLLEEKNNH